MLGLVGRKEADIAPPASVRCHGVVARATGPHSQTASTMAAVQTSCGDRPKSLDGTPPPASHVTRTMDRPLPRAPAETSGGSNAPPTAPETFYGVPVFNSDPCAAWPPDPWTLASILPSRMNLGRSALNATSAAGHRQRGAPAEAGHNPQPWAPWRQPLYSFPCRFQKQGPASAGCRRQRCTPSAGRAACRHDRPGHAPAGQPRLPAMRHRIPARFLGCAGLLGPPRQGAQLGVPNAQALGRKGRKDGSRRGKATQQAFPRLWDAPAGLAPPRLGGPGSREPARRAVPRLVNRNATRMSGNSGVFFMARGRPER